MTKQETLYFKSIDDTFCYSLEDHFNEYEKGEEITLVEAIPDDGTQSYIWCTHYGEVVEKHDCKKSVCSYYKSKSGRGVCSHKGKLYNHGEEKTFIIP